MIQYMYQSIIEYIRKANEVFARWLERLGFAAFKLPCFSVEGADGSRIEVLRTSSANAFRIRIQISPIMVSGIDISKRQFGDIIKILSEIQSSEAGKELFWSLNSEVSMQSIDISKENGFTTIRYTGGRRKLVFI